jgi:hypothetical protein
MNWQRSLESVPGLKQRAATGRGYVNKGPELLSSCYYCTPKRKRSGLNTPKIGGLYREICFQGESGVRISQGREIDNAILQQVQKIIKFNKGVFGQ